MPIIIGKIAYWGAISAAAYFAGGAIKETGKTSEKLAISALAAGSVYLIIKKWG
jgi:hypothetical protein